MGIDLLVGSAMALLYPAAKRAAGAIAEGFLADAADNAYASAGKFMNWLKGKWADDPKGTRALEDVVDDPDDEISRETLRQRLAKAAEDPDFREQLEQQIEERGPAVDVFISIKEMEGVTGLDVGEFRSGQANVTLTGEKATDVIGAKINKLG
jgi:hypothetical protein